MAIRVRLETNVSVARVTAVTARRRARRTRFARQGSRALSRPRANRANARASSRWVRRAAQPISALAGNVLQAQAFSPYVRAFVATKLPRAHQAGSATTQKERPFVVPFE